MPHQVDCWIDVSREFREKRIIFVLVKQTVIPLERRTLRNQFRLQFST